MKFGKWVCNLSMDAVQPLGSSLSIYIKEALQLVKKLLCVNLGKGNVTGSLHRCGVGEVLF